jgi:DNA-binding transcriptional MerR regulator
MNRSTIAVALAALLLLGGVAGVTTALPAQPTTTASQAEATPQTDEMAPDGDHPRLDRLLHALAERYDLTDEQVAELETLVLRLHEDGADRAEIERAVVAQLSEYGVDPADLREDRQRVQDHREHRDRTPWRVGLGAFADSLDLTDDQRETLRETAAEARERGAYPAEVRVAVLDELREFGYTDAEIRAALLDGRVAAIGHRYDLTDEQSAEVRATVADLREDGAFHVEIRAAVIDLLREYGALPADTPPERPDRPDRPTARR